MKNSIKVWALFLLLFSISVSAVSGLTLNPEEVLYLNSISRFFDNKPEGEAIKRLEKSLNSSNPCVKGVGALILYKHFKNPFKNVFYTCFTLNSKIDDFDAEDKKFIRLSNVKRILDQFSDPLSRIKDNRVRRIFMFFHFRHIHLWLVGKSEEKLSLAEFYRISAIDSVFGPGVDVIKLVDGMDKL
jgi:hypothetical protein